MNYLQLVNRVLTDLNEVVLTDVTNARGIQITAKDAVDTAIRSIVNEEVEWPFLHSVQTDTLTIGVNEYALPATYTNVDWDNFVLRPLELFANGDFTTDLTSWSDISAGTGSIAYTADGDGRMRLTGDGTNAGAAEQGVSTVVGKDYHVTFRFFSNDVTMKIGTTSGGSEISSETFVLENDGQGFEAETTFTATATTTYIGFSNTSTTAADVDQASVRRDVRPVHLRYLNYDTYVRRYRSDVEYKTPTSFDIPFYVYRTKNDKFGVYPVPDEAYEITFEYWTAATDLTVNASTTEIPDRYHDTIIHGAKSFVLETRSDPVFRDRMRKAFEEGIAKMRTDLINRSDSMQAV